MKREEDHSSARVSEEQLAPVCARASMDGNGTPAADIGCRASINSAAAVHVNASARVNAAAIDPSAPCNNGMPGVDTAPGPAGHNGPAATVGSRNADGAGFCETRSGCRYGRRSEIGMRGCCKAQRQNSNRNLRKMFSHAGSLTSVNEAIPLA